VNNLAFYIGLGVGLALAAGLRPFLPALLSGALAAAGILGVDFHRGNYGFLQSGWWLIAMGILLLVTYLAQLRGGPELLDQGLPSWILAAMGLAVGALLFGGTLCEHGYAAWPGLLGGVAAALLGQFAARPLVQRTRARLPEGGARQALTVYVDGAALLLAILVSLLHVLGFAALAVFAWIAWRSRGRGPGKYAGLRILGG
jgi:hypothetical protein